MNWGIMGLGHIAHDFATQMNKTRPIYGVAGRTAEEAEQFGKEFQVLHKYSSYEEMVSDPDIDIIYVATVNSQHLKDIKMSLEAGKHVMCEKAIWGDYEEIKAMYDLAHSKGLILAEAMTIYHMPLFGKIRDLISDGKLGKIKMIQVDLGSLKDDNPNNRFFSKELGGGAMLDIGTYVLSFVRHFTSGKLNDPVYVMRKYPTGVDEMWSISFDTESGVIANTNMTFRAKLPKRAVITGDKAYVEVYNYVRAETAKIVYPDFSSENISAGETERALSYEIEDFEATVNNPALGLDYAQQTLDVVGVMDKLLKAENI
ncbi:Gfo/Idh/MocA family protein [Lacticaseibacillus hegangensis]|uniref:Gfo/Idh/MocA family protein n=1 Tax=Lacticaseibacillus hegangensis TaxID=2486010 RepID=A0ABW4CX75_9LACO|nr:Gfo/Idh/MocA family oxidoreductase [Lacticaseibacillus hegangensis]